MVTIVLILLALLGVLFIYTLKATPKTKLKIKEARRINMLLSNIENYNGTSSGQKRLEVKE